jgi:hypothetical protein
MLECEAVLIDPPKRRKEHDKQDNLGCLDCFSEKKAKMR